MGRFSSHSILPSIRRSPSFPQDLHQYIDFSPLRSPTLGQSVVFTYFFVFALYWSWSLLSLFANVQSAWTMRSFFLHKLGITTRELQTMDW